MAVLRHCAAHSSGQACFPEQAHMCMYAQSVLWLGRTFYVSLHDACVARNMLRLSFVQTLDVVHGLYWILANLVASASTGMQ